jgi:ethanolamine utilization microcompartment shell protein EutS
MYQAGVRIAQISSALLAQIGAITATTTITAGTGLTVTAGNGVITAGDLRVTAGNARLGAVSAFATTEPTSALVMKAGTAPVGAITTSGGIFSTATVVQKIIAAGTVNNVES